MGLFVFGLTESPGLEYKIVSSRFLVYGPPDWWCSLLRQWKPFPVLDERHLFNKFISSASRKWFHSFTAFDSSVIDSAVETLDIRLRKQKITNGIDVHWFWNFTV